MIALPSRSPGRNPNSTTWLRRAARWGVRLGLAFGLCSCAEPRREHVQHGRFESVELRVPRGAHGVVLVLAGAQDTALADVLSAQVAERGAVAARVDADAFAGVLEATPGCVVPSGDLDNLARFVQAYSKLSSYEPAILVGVGRGARLAAAALAQAPVDTFAGALLLGGCRGAALQVPLCPRDPTSDPPGPVVVPKPLVLGSGPACSDPVTSEAGSDADKRAALAQFPAALAELAELARARGSSGPSDVADVPITEVIASGGDHPDTFGILLSGDGGWAGIDKALSTRLARRGLPIVGIDSLRYFWTARTPESTAADLDRVIRRYRAAWKRDRVVLMGYSQGADVLPFILNRLPDETRTAVVSAIALSLSGSATFEFHVSSWIGASGDRPTLPEVQRQAHQGLVCVYGRGDHDALCPALPADGYRLVALPGDHHFGGDYDRLTAVVLESIPPG